MTRPKRARRRYKNPTTKDLDETFKAPEDTTPEDTARALFTKRSKKKSKNKS